MDTKQLIKLRKEQTEQAKEKILEITGYVKLPDECLRTLYGYMVQFDYLTVMSAIELAFDQYYNPYGEPYDEWDSFLNALHKVGGICYNWTVHGGKI